MGGLAGTTDSGIRLAALARSWLVAIAGFGGMRDHGTTITFVPRLPRQPTRLSFRLHYWDRRRRVEVRAAVRATSSSAAIRSTSCTTVKPSRSPPTRPR